MAKLEIEITPHVREKLDAAAARKKMPAEEVAAELVASGLGIEAGEEAAAADQVPHEEWLRTFHGWLATLPRTGAHLTNEDLRRVNMYGDDERC